jgi:hypothetical protein
VAEKPGGFKQTTREEWSRDSPNCVAILWLESNLCALRVASVFRMVSDACSGRGTGRMQRLPLLGVHIDHDPPADLARKYFGRKSGNFFKSSNGGQRFELVLRQVGLQPIPSLNSA